MQKNLSKENSVYKALKYLLMVFIAISIAAVVYKIAKPCCSNDEKTQDVSETTTASPPTGKNANEEALPAEKIKAQKNQQQLKSAPQESKTAVVYYFYTNTRCSSCKAIEAYTREAVETQLSSGYNGWKVEFKGVNVDLRENSHFIQDYWLNSKSVVVQKFQDGKPENWGLLRDVWQLLGNKETFINYIVSETKKVIDSR
ncbi:MAG: hypothetical protein Fur0012_10300 [Elusimicrobiota bacterium]